MSTLLKIKLTIFVIAIYWITPSLSFSYRRSDFNEQCPKVKSMSNFQIDKMMGFWHIVQYYSSTEETLEYRCMQSELKITDQMEITMNFTYAYIYDSDNDFLNGNITWAILDFEYLSHWAHSEDFYEGIYNTYVIDTDYENWALMMNCAEKKKNPRYLSALLMSRGRSLGHNVKVYLREKLLKYNIDLNFMFPVEQDKCDNLSPSINMKYYYDHFLKLKFTNDSAQ